MAGNRWIGFGLTLLLVLSGCAIKKGGEERRNREVALVEVERARVAELPMEVKVIGKVKGSSLVRVFPKAGGKLLRYVVKEGDRVKKDDVIAEVDRDITGFDYQVLKVRSPVDGVVVSEPLDVGEAIGVRTVVAVVSQEGELEFVGSVSEEDLVGVKVGQRTRVVVPALGDREFEGEVKSVSRLVDEVSRTSRVRIGLKGEEDLLPGMYAVAYIEVGRKKEVVVPLDSVVKIPGSNVYYCYRVRDGRIELRQVVLDEIRGDVVGIISGIEEGDDVVVSAQGRLKDGQEVKVVRQR